MAQGTIVLGQLLALVSTELFDKLATLYKVNKGVRKMTASAHFAVMLFIQVAGMPSLTCTANDGRSSCSSSGSSRTSRSKPASGPT